MQKRPCPNLSGSPLSISGFFIEFLSFLLFELLFSVKLGEIRLIFTLLKTARKKIRADDLQIKSAKN
jgi:hypothetical protein